MKRMLLGMSMVAAMLLVASSAFAGGINIRWSDCLIDGGLSYRAFACASNAGSNALVSSFSIDTALPQSSGQEVVVDFISANPTLPAWWEFKNPGTCRLSSLSMNFVIPGSALLCVDWATGGASGGIGAYNANLGSIDPSFSGQHRRLVAAIAVPGTALVDLLANTEYFSNNILINNAKTIGTGSCAGCIEPVCIVFNSIKLTTQVAANDRILGAPSVAGSNQATWQGGVGANCAAVPTKNATWSQVKSLYR